MSDKSFDPATVFDRLMTESAEKYMFRHLKAHQTFVDAVHKQTGIYQWDLTYRDKMLIALAIKSALAA